MYAVPILLSDLSAIAHRLHLRAGAEGVKVHGWRNTAVHIRHMRHVKVERRVHQSWVQSERWVGVVPHDAGNILVV